MAWLHGLGKPLLDWDIMGKHWALPKTLPLLSSVPSWAYPYFLGCSRGFFGFPNSFLDVWTGRDIIITQSILGCC